MWVTSLRITSKCMTKGVCQKEMRGCMFSACDGVSAEVNKIMYGRKSEMHIRKKLLTP